jgi:hypothetical protein
MKKIYLSLIALSLGGLTFGQTAGKNAIAFKTQDNDHVKTATNVNQNNKSTVLWTDDFSTPSNWTMTGGTPTNWTIGQSASGAGGFPLADLVSTSGAPFALFDSDGVNAAGPQDATIEMTTGIPTLGNPYISVQFENYFRPYSSTAVYVEVEADGSGTWTQFQVHGSIAVNGATANPEVTTVNVSSAITGATTMKVRFHYTGDWDYGWAIDDIKIQTSDDNDIVASEAFYGFGATLTPYSRIPVTQITSADFMIKATNVGAKDQPNTLLNVDVDGGTFTGTSATTTLVTGTTDSLFCTTQYTPATTIGVPHTVTLTVSSDSVDASPANNTVVFPPFEISQYIYAQDNYTATPGAGGGTDANTTPPSEEFEAGNYYDAFFTEQVYAVDVMIGTGTPVGTAIEGVLYDGTTATFVELDRSNIYITVAGDVGKVITLILPTAPTITAGNNYFAAVHAFTEFNYGIGGTSPSNTDPSGPTSLIFYPNMTAPASGQNYYTTQTPMIRLNFDPTVGIDELNNNVNFSVYPNPSNGEFTVNLTADNSDNVNLTVTNVVGQTIINKSVVGNRKTTISLTDYSKGIYFLTIGNKTTKLIVE